MQRRRQPKWRPGRGGREAAATLSCLGSLKGTQAKDTRDRAEKGRPEAVVLKGRARYSARREEGAGPSMLAGGCGRWRVPG